MSQLNSLRTLSIRTSTILFLALVGCSALSFTTVTVAQNRTYQENGVTYRQETRTVRVPVVTYREEKQVVRVPLPKPAAPRITYRDERRAVQVPVRDVRMEEREQLFFKDEYRTVARNVTQTHYMPVTKCECVPVWHSWWRLLQGCPPEQSYQWQQRTDYVPQSRTVSVPITQRVVVPQRRKVQVAVPYLRFEEQTRMVRVPVTEGQSSTGIRQAARRSSDGFRPVGDPSTRDGDYPERRLLRGYGDYRSTHDRPGASSTRTSLPQYVRNSSYTSPPDYWTSPANRDVRSFAPGRDAYNAYARNVGQSLRSGYRDVTSDYQRYTPPASVGYGTYRSPDGGIGSHQFGPVGGIARLEGDRPRYGTGINTRSGSGGNGYWPARR